VVTNDASWPARVEKALPGQAVCVLQDLRRG